MWPFNFKLFSPAPIWKETGREFARSDRRFSNYPHIEYEFFDVYAVHYKDIRSDKTKIEEKWELI